MHLGRLAPVAAVAAWTIVWLLPGTPARAQDLFEIQIYEYDTVPKNKWNLETHLNHIARGTKEFDRSAAPTDNQVHLTWELTRGITDNFEIAGYLVTAQRPGGGYEFAGCRVRPRVSVPERWRWPVDVSMSFEVGFPRPAYERNSVTLELRPIIEKTFSQWRLTFNPVVGRALKGPDSEFDFEPGAKASYFLLGKDKLNVGLEYYGAPGALTGFSPLKEQVHLLFPTADIYFNDNLMLNVGVGAGLTSAGERLIVKARLGWRF